MTQNYKRVKRMLQRHNAILGQMYVLWTIQVCYRKDLEQLSMNKKWTNPALTQTHLKCRMRVNALLTHYPVLCNKELRLTNLLLRRAKI